MLLPVPDQQQPLRFPTSEPSLTPTPLLPVNPDQLVVPVDPNQRQPQQDSTIASRQANCLQHELTIQQDIKPTTRPRPVASTTAIDSRRQQTNCPQQPDRRPTRHPLPDRHTVRILSETPTPTQSKHQHQHSLAFRRTTKQSCILSSRPPSRLLISLIERSPQNFFSDQQQQTHLCFPTCTLPAQAVFANHHRLNKKQTVYATFTFPPIFLKRQHPVGPLFLPRFSLTTSRLCLQATIFFYLA